MSKAVTVRVPMLVRCPQWTGPRVVEVPPDFQQALDQDPVAKAAFQKIPYTHQREYVRAILEAKREETRRSRIAKAIEMLKAKK